MQSTQVSVQAIHYPSIVYQYQDTVELQGTVLESIIGTGLAQETKTTILNLLIVRLNPKVPGGAKTASNRTSMATTIMEYTHPRKDIGMVWCGPHGGDTVIPSELLR